MVHYYYGGLSEAALASEQGLVHAERAHDLQRQAQHRLVRMHSAQGGFTPLGQVNDLLVDDLDWARQTGSLEVEAKATMRLSAVRGALGDPTGRDELFARGTSACSELGLDNWAAGFNAIWIWGLTDDPAVAEARLRRATTCSPSSGLASGSRRWRRSSPTASTGRAATRRPRRCWTRPRMRLTTTTS